MADDAVPVELTAPDISTYAKGTHGLDYVHTFDGGRTGPHVVVNALTHGNEICGAIALDRLMTLGVRPLRGRMTFAFVNVGAYGRFDPANPNASRFVDEDFNRVWTEDQLDGKRDSAELRRARQLRGLFDTADFLLDIHSMGTRSNALIICHGLDKERKLAGDVGCPAWVVAGSGHIQGQRLIEYTPFNDRGNAKTALLVECGQHWEKNAAVVALDTALHFLRATGAISPALCEALATQKQPRPQTVLDVSGGYSAKTERFRFVERFIGLDLFPKAGTVVAKDGEDDVVTPHDGCYLIMPNHRAKKGERALRFGRKATVAA
jgi:predicted deacylase